MRFSTSAIYSVIISAGTASAFAPSQPAFVGHALRTETKVSAPAAFHSSSCACAACMMFARGSTLLFSEIEEAAEGEAEEPVPEEVVALDGIESAEEAHNTDRPARESIKKKRAPRGKPLEEFTLGSSVKGSVRTITSYGAFIDIGASTDGLLHISQLSSGFVSEVSEVLEVGQEVDVRIININADKNQVGLTILTEEEEEKAKSGGGGGGRRQGGGGGRKDDSKVMAGLTEKGWDSGKFIAGKVVSTVDFGAFVKIDVSQLNEEVEGEIDGLVHISALSVGRCDAVTSIVNEGDDVQVRLRSIDGRKASLSLISLEDEEAAAEKRGGGGPPKIEGAKDWKEQYEKLLVDMPQFSNNPTVVDMRK